MPGEAAPIACGACQKSRKAGRCMADHSRARSRRRRISAEIAGNRTRTDRERRGAAARASRPDRAAREQSIQHADVHVQPRPRRATGCAMPWSEAARRGVEVQLLIDGFGSAAPPEILRRARRGGRRALRLQPELRAPLFDSESSEAGRCSTMRPRSSAAPTSTTLSQRPRRRRVARPVAADRRPGGGACRAAISTSCSAGSMRKNSHAALRCGG